MLELICGYSNYLYLFKSLKNFIWRCVKPRNCRLVLPSSNCFSKATKLLLPNNDARSSMVYRVPFAWLRWTIFRLIIFSSICLVSVIIFHWSSGECFGIEFQLRDLSFAITVYLIPLLSTF